MKESGITVSILYGVENGTAANLVTTLGDFWGRNSRAPFEGAASDKLEPLGLDKRNVAKGQKLSWMTQAGPQNFRNLAVALLCCLDVSLSWTSLDFFGWMGKAEDTESGLLARSPRCRDLSTLQEFAGKLRQSLKMAWSSQRFWQQFEMHLYNLI